MSEFNKKWTYCRLALTSALLSSNLLLLNACAVTQCGVLQLQKVAKPGVDVSNNICTGSDMALDSIVHLKPDTSVRLVSSSGKPGAAGNQIICQNQSSFPLKIRIASAALPWIQPEQDLIHCGGWLNDRLECNSLRGDKTALVCAISEKENTIISRGDLTKIPPRMRSLQSDNPDFEMEQQKVKDVLQSYVIPKIEQCQKNNPSDQVLTLTWKIKANGVVTGTTLPENISEDEFVDCAIEVIEDFVFPSFPKEIQVTYKF